MLYQLRNGLWFGKAYELVEAIPPTYQVHP